MAQWMAPAVIAFLAWGVWAYLPKHIVSYINPKSAALYEIAGALLLGIIILGSSGFKLETHPKGIALAMITGALGLVGSLAYLYAVSKGPVAVISFFTALYPVVTVILAYLFLNEVISLKQLLGIVCAMAAIYLLSS